MQVCESTTWHACTQLLPAAAGRSRHSRRRGRKWSPVATWKRLGSLNRPHFGRHIESFVPGIPLGVASFCFLKRWCARNRDLGSAWSGEKAADAAITPPSLLLRVATGSCISSTEYWLVCTGAPPNYAARSQRMTR